jgi:hypothetical protein
MYRFDLALGEPTKSSSMILGFCETVKRNLLFPSEVRHNERAVSRKANKELCLNQLASFLLAVPSYQRLMFH